MTRRDNRYRTNSLNQLQESRTRNRELLENRIIGVDLASQETELDENLIQESSLDEGIYQIDTLTNSNSRSGTRGRRSDMAMFYESDWFSDCMMFARPIISRERESNQYIRSYNYVPYKFNFNTVENENENLFLGIELEIDKGGRTEETAKFIQEFLGEDNCYIMHDGSLDDGLEIVTHPSTLNYHKQQPYRELFKKLSNKGYKSHDTRTCGYHIHINRNFFSEDPTIQDLCITKILYLTEKYWKDVKRIARRDANNYSQRFDMKEDESMFKLLIKAKGEYSSKYNMINLQHKKTIEFRMFRGTLKYETFIATMEFVYNLAYICKNTSLENIQNIKFKNILDINPTEYLIDYLNSRR